MGGWEVCRAKVTQGLGLAAGGQEVERWAVGCCRQAPWHTLACFAQALLPGRATGADTFRTCLLLPPACSHRQPAVRGVRRHGVHEE